MKTLLKGIAASVVVLLLGAVNLSAQTAVKMTFSGTSENTANDLLQPNASNDEDHFTGISTLGSFNLGEVRAISNNPSPSASCSGINQLHFSEPAGGGIFRFGDGSLLYVQMTQGDDCIDFSVNSAHCVLQFQVTGGTGRLANASGTLTLTEKVVPVLTDALGNPVYLAATGQITGQLWGVTNPLGASGAQ
ncbi:hypothetical protein [Occallatibacter savannae]|uniref:hypothetical protein n=1 Tax=Occallatibacter savannae TaxID=1002691 RepID=UPI000D697441|nr:hypothetical protein [Occallatibacter savannae]